MRVEIDKTHSQRLMNNNLSQRLKLCVCYLIMSAVNYLAFDFSSGLRFAFERFLLPHFLSLVLGGLLFSVYFYFFF